MGLGILDDNHLDHVPGTALLTDMLDAEHHQFHGKIQLPMLSSLSHLFIFV